MSYFFRKKYKISSYGLFDLHLVHCGIKMNSKAFKKKKKKELKGPLSIPKKKK
jgi:hypothetical protein